LIDTKILSMRYLFLVPEVVWNSFYKEIKPDCWCIFVYCLLWFISVIVI